MRKAGFGTTRQNSGFCMEGRFARRIAIRHTEEKPSRRLRGPGLHVRIDIFDDPQAVLYPAALQPKEKDPLPPHELRRRK
jgi:hypothetical protein